MSRVRSPNYPALSLPDAVARTAQAFAKEHRHWAPKEVIVKAMGYGGVNGTSMSALSAVAKYGLIDKDGEKYRVSDRAITILHPRDPQEKGVALRAAAAEPALFAEMMQEFPGAPVSDDNLRSYLIRRGFSSGALAPVIKSYRDTMEIAAVVPEGYSQPKELVVETGIPMSTARTVEARAPIVGGATVAATAMVVPKTPFSVEMMVDRVTVTGNLTDQTQIDTLIMALQMARSMLPPAKPKAEIATAEAVKTE